MFSGISEHRFSVCLLFSMNDLQMSGSWAQSCLQEQSERLHMRVETKRFGSTPWRPSVHQRIWTPTDRKHKQFWEKAEKNLNVKFPLELKIQRCRLDLIHKWILTFSLSLSLSLTNSCSVLLNSIRKIKIYVDTLSKPENFLNLQPAWWPGPSRRSSREGKLTHSDIKVWMTFHMKTL